MTLQASLFPDVAGVWAALPVARCGLRTQCTLFQREFALQMDKDTGCMTFQSGIICRMKVMWSACRPSRVLGLARHCESLTWASVLSGRALLLVWSTSRDDGIAGIFVKTINGRVLALAE